VVVDVDGVKVAGFTNLPGRIAADASALYAKNLLALLPLFTGENAAFGPKWDDEIVKAAVLTRDGQVVHPALKDG
jgi:NAD(P) transhydrogenase subunit alpha